MTPEYMAAPRTNNSVPSTPSPEPLPILAPCFVQSPSLEHQSQERERWMHL